MRPISEIFEDIRRYLKERGQIHDNDFWERQAHFEHLERLINAELDIKTIVSWCENGMKKFKGTIPYISSQRYYDYLQELHQIINGSNSVVALFFKNMSNDQISIALKNALESKNNFVKELFEIIKNAPKQIEKIFLASVKEKNIPMVNLLLNNNVDMTALIYYAAKRSDDELIYQLIVQPYRMHKKELVQKGPIVSATDFSQRKPSVAEAMLTRVFNESTKDTRALSYEMNKIAGYGLVQDIISIAALAALGKHDAGKARSKQLTLIVSDDLTQFNPIHQKEKGIYNAKNSVYIVGTPDANLGVVSIIIHEITHFVAQEIFKFAANPYSGSDGVNRKVFDEILQKVQGTLGAMQIQSKQEEIMMLMFKDVFELYDPLQWAAELIVRVPQFISLFGEKESGALLKQHFPELLNYYEKVFLPACKQYLVEHHADQFLEVSFPKELSNILRT